MSLGDNVVIAGLPFYENFVVVYDYDISKVRLGLNTNAVEGASIQAGAHWDPILDKIKEFSGWALAAIIIGLVITVLLILCCVGYLCHMICKRRQENNEAKYALYSDVPARSVTSSTDGAIR